VSSVGGSSRPSVIAVLKLITSSYFVGACTGRSADLSPLRMRPVEPATSRTGQLDQPHRRSGRPHRRNRGSCRPRGFVLGRKRDDQIALGYRQSARGHDQAACQSRLGISANRPVWALYEPAAGGPAHSAVAYACSPPALETRPC
jgi:hypothetical protein